MLKTICITCVFEIAAHKETDSQLIADMIQRDVDRYLHLSADNKFYIVEVEDLNDKE